MGDTYQSLAVQAKRFSKEIIYGAESGKVEKTFKQKCEHGCFSPEGGPTPSCSLCNSRLPQDIEPAPVTFANPNLRDIEDRLLEDQFKEFTS